MPTPKRATARAGPAGGANTDAGAGMGSPQEDRGRRRGPRRESPSHKSAREGACDQRSAPQDVTSSRTDAKGSICSKRSGLTRPKDLPRDSPAKAASLLLVGG